MLAKLFHDAQVCPGLEFLDVNNAILDGLEIAQPIAIDILRKPKWKFRIECINRLEYGDEMIERNLEVKLPTTWTDESQRWEESENKVGRGSQRREE